MGFHPPSNPRFIPARGLPIVVSNKQIIVFNMCSFSRFWSSMSFSTSFWTAVESWNSFCVNWFPAFGKYVGTTSKLRIMKTSQQMLVHRRHRMITFLSYMCIRNATSDNSTRNWVIESIITRRLECFIEMKNDNNKKNTIAMMNFIAAIFHEIDAEDALWNEE